MAISDRNIVITPNVSAVGPAQPKIVFTGADSSIGDSAAITLFANPENSGTLSFSGSQGQLFSVTNNLSGTIFAVSDISGIPSLEIDDNGIVKIAEYNGRVLIGGATDDSSSALQVSGTVKATTSGILGGDGSASGVTIQDGAITVRTDTGSEAYIDLYCEVSNAHRTRIQSASHASYSGDVTVTLPTTTGTLALTSDISGSAITVQDEGSSLSTAAEILNFVGSGVTASGTGTTKTITISGGGGGEGGLDSAAVLTVIGSAALDADTVDGYHMEVVSSMPASPDSSTVYFVTG